MRRLWQDGYKLIVDLIQGNASQVLCGWRVRSATYDVLVEEMPLLRRLTSIPGLILSQRQLIWGPRWSWCRRLVGLKGSLRLWLRIMDMTYAL